MLHVRAGVPGDLSRYIAYFTAPDPMWSVRRAAGAGFAGSRLEFRRAAVVGFGSLTVTYVCGPAVPVGGSCERVGA